MYFFQGNLMVRVINFFNNSFGGKDAKTFLFNIQFYFKIIKIIFIKLLAF